MTRIALCYSGQPRDFIHAVDNHREHFGLGQDNVDVFGHIWFDDSVAGKVFTIPSKGVWPSSEIKDWISTNWKPRLVNTPVPIIDAIMNEEAVQNEI